MRRNAFFLLLFLLSLLSLQAQRQDFSPRAERLRGHVFFLASDDMRGRKAGTDDALRAAQYILEQYQAVGLQPFRGDYWMPFSSSSDYASTMGDKLGGMVDAALSTATADRKFRNIVACIEGSDPELKDEFIVIGAHYDHLGVMGSDIYNGADDNASGTACVIEMARILMEHRSELKRSVVICAFDAEELGLFGSRALAQWMKNEKVRLMMSIDMVGWYRQSGHLILEGTGTMENGKALAQRLASRQGLNVRCKRVETSLLTATDTEPFAKMGIPTLAVTTGLKSPYHKPEDDAYLIDYEGLANIAEFLSTFTLEAASGPTLNATGHLAAKHGGIPPRLQMGVAAGVNRMTLDFAGPAFTTHSRLGYSAGLSACLNLSSHVSLRASALFAHPRTTLPSLDLEAQTAQLASASSASLNALSVPVAFYVRPIGNASAVDLLMGAGVSFNYLFSHSLSPLQIESPTSFFFGIGLKMGRMEWMLDWHRHMGSLTSDGPKAKARMVEFQMNYFLW